MATLFEDGLLRRSILFRLVVRRGIRKCNDCKEDCTQRNRSSAEVRAGTLRAFCSLLENEGLHPGA
jgi:hypothetical protein